MIETDRLILRAPEDRDRDAIAAINGDPRVGEWLGATLTRQQSDDLVDRVAAWIASQGYGFWAVERKADGAVIGHVGLFPMGEEMPLAPALEIGWRLSPDAWGQGYASEAARAALAWGFAHQEVDEIVAVTADSNMASQAVMRRIGMVPDPGRDFDHPRLAPDHPLRRHVTFVARRPA